MDSQKPNEEISTLPPLYAKWISQIIQGAIPTEKGATCSNCAMCATPEQLTGKTKNFFIPEIKCCSYIPEMYNFLTGNILSEPDASSVPARDALISGIQNKANITPLGVGRSKRYALLYKYSPHAFGKNLSIKCPYYVSDGGLCGVWKHRNAVCSTWFCKHEQGATGFYFWRNVQQVLEQVEENLSVWCILKLGLKTESLRELAPLFVRQTDSQTADLLDANELDEIPDEKKYRLVWGEWLGRETEFFVACGKLVSELSWSQILDICEPKVQLSVQLLQDAYQRLTNTDFLDNLKPGNLKVSLANADSVSVETYSKFDPLSIPPVILEIIPYFDGQPLQEVIDKLAEEKNIQVDMALIRKLADFQILIPASKNE